MQIQQRHDMRVSALIFHCDDSGVPSIILHQAPEKREPAAVKEGQKEPLPHEPETWLSVTAKTHRSPDGYVSVLSCARKKYGVTPKDVKDCGDLISEPVTRNGRRHYWLWLELNQRLSLEVKPAFMTAVAWFSHHNIADVLPRMTPDWQVHLRKVLDVMAEQNPSFKELAGAFQHACAD